MKGRPGKARARLARTYSKISNPASQVAQEWLSSAASAFLI
jgi:hypothetical protein